ncbi:MAG: hypothetical protein M1814_004167 [Vezdaea aestivalis]|nr:MAG: hypothetical protein M1814_004167 [Vezdaea aestivalis]
MEAGQSNIVFVDRLATKLQIEPDAWGKACLQPALISVKVFLAQASPDDSLPDSIDKHTVHYGNLSRSLLSITAFTNTLVLPVVQTPWSLSSLALEVRQKVRKTIETAGNVDILLALGIDIELPKASSTGSSLKWSVFCDESSYPSREDAESAIRRRLLCLCGIRLPAIIGIHPHERLMKQTVIFDISIRSFLVQGGMGPPIEQIAVKTAEEAQYQTLESLVALILRRICVHWAFRCAPDATITVTASKPIAVRDAEKVGVTIVRKTDRSLPFGKYLWKECGEKLPAEIPFPLQGRLDAFLETAQEQAI